MESTTFDDALLTSLFLHPRDGNKKNPDEIPGFHWTKNRNLGRQIAAHLYLTGMANLHARLR